MTIKTKKIKSFDFIIKRRVRIINVERFDTDGKIEYLFQVRMKDLNGKSKLYPNSGTGRYSIKTNNISEFKRKIKNKFFDY